MPSKTTKRARRAAGKNNAPVPKDDGTRWVVINKETGRPAYITYGGVTKAEAERLSEGLVVETEIQEVT